MLKAPKQQASPKSLPQWGNGVKYRKRYRTDEVTDAKHPQKVHSENHLISHLAVTASPQGEAF